MTNIKVASMPKTITQILDDLGLNDIGTNRRFRDPPSRLVKLPDDPVVLACASYRMYQENPRHRWMDFEQVVVWQGDREEAERLKAYYQEKFKQSTFDRLKNTNSTGLSEFRRKLFMLVNNDLQITDREIGMLYRLPYFYAEDLGLDFIMNSTKSAPQHVPMQKQVLKLTLLKKILRSRNGGEFNQYWFAEQSSDYVYMLPVKTDNILANFFDGMTSKPLKIESTVICKNLQGRNDHRYFYLADPRLV